jgi:hypothetical protein
MWVGGDISSAVKPKTPYPDKPVSILPYRKYALSYVLRRYGEGSAADTSRRKWLVAAAFSASSNRFDTS